jgi:tripartite-type tricarboxylate transporter receptor subunit TctC
MTLRRRLTLALLAMAAALPVHAQTYPARPIRMLVGFPPNGAADIIARIVGRRLGEALGQQVVIDNRPGAGSALASEITAKAAPDGYTLLMASSSHAANAALYQKLPYDPIADFAAVILTASAAQAFVANPSLPVKSASDVIQLAREKPGQLNYATGGTGSTTHLAGELFIRMANIRLTHVPYKGAAPALAAVLAGEVPLMFGSLPGTLAQIRAGRVRPIGVTSAKRSPSAPEIPTLAESGIPGYEATNWYGILAPRGTPASIVNHLNTEVLRLLHTPEVAEAVTRQGADPLGSTPAEFESYMKSEIAKWTRVVREAGIRAN